MIDRSHGKLSIVRQCALLGVSRSGLYYQPMPENEANVALMRLIDEIYTAYPFMGSRQIKRELRRRGHAVNRKRGSRLMGVMGLAAVGPGPQTSRPHPHHPKYPYLLRGMVVDRPNQVWVTEIVCTQMTKANAFAARMGRDHIPDLDFGIRNC